MESLLLASSEPTVSWGEGRTGYVLSSWQDFKGTQYVKVTTREGVVTNVLASTLLFLAEPTAPLKDLLPDFAFVSPDGQMSAYNCLATNQPGDTILLYERCFNGVRSFNVKDLLLSGCKAVPWAQWTAEQAERAEAAAILAERRAALRSLPTEEDEAARSAQRDAKVLAREQLLAAEATRLAEQEQLLSAEEARLAAEATRLAERAQLLSAEEARLEAETARLEAETARLAERAQPVAARLAAEAEHDTLMAQELGLISPVRRVASLVQSAPLVEGAVQTATAITLSALNLESIPGPAGSGDVEEARQIDMAVLATVATAADRVPAETPMRLRRVASLVPPSEPDIMFAAPNLGISIADYSDAARQISAWSEDEFNANWKLFWGGLGVAASLVGPRLRKKNIQIWLTVQAVCSKGGFESVSFKSGWKAVAVAQNSELDGPACSVSTTMRLKYLETGMFAFERHNVAVLRGIDTPYTLGTSLTRGLLKNRVVYKLVETADTPASSSGAAAAPNEAAEATALPSPTGIAVLLGELHPSTSLFPPGVPGFPLAAVSESGDLDGLDVLDGFGPLVDGHGDLDGFGPLGDGQGDLFDTM